MPGHIGFFVLFCFPEREFFSFIMKVEALSAFKSLTLSQKNLLEEFIILIFHQM